MRKALLNFMHRDRWCVSFLDEDARTTIGRKFEVADGEALMRIIAKLRGNEARARTAMYNWGKGSEWVELTPAQCEYFGIKEKYGHSK